MTLLKGGEEIVPGIGVKTFRGHTAGMQAVIIGKAVATWNSGQQESQPSFPVSRERMGQIETPQARAEFSQRHPSGAKVQTSPDPGGTPEAVPFPDRAPHTACYISDLMPTTAHIDLTWGMGFDLYPLDTIESKKQYYARALAEKWLTVFTHDPQVPWAYIEQDQSGKMVAKEAI
jgi:hypothetical protein